MAFEKGNKHGGRKKGSKGKASSEIKEFLSEFLHENLDDLQGCIQSMKAPDRFNAYMQVAKFIIPTMKAMDVKLEAESDFKPIQINFIRDDKFPPR